jgi:hypothetical protein
MLNSQYQPLCTVVLPFRSRQRYMHTFDLANPIMAEGFEDYLEPVKRLCTAAGANVGIAHMTVDEKIVEAGMSQRKPRPHIDGRFMPEKMRWGGGGWNHHCNEIPQRMPIIVAASVAGCRVWRGQIDGSPNEHGGCEHLIDQLDAGEIVPANVGYLLSGDCIHESMVFDQQVKRTFLRIALPVDFAAPPQS